MIGCGKFLSLPFAGQLGQIWATFIFLAGQFMVKENK